MKCFPFHNFDSRCVCNVKTCPCKMIEKNVFFSFKRVELTDNKRVHCKFTIAQIWDGDLYNIDEVTIFPQILFLFSN